MDKIVFLEGKRIYLRNLEEQDLNARYLQWLNDPEVCGFNEHAIFPNSFKKMRDYFEFAQNTNNAVVLAIVAKDTHAHIGNVCLQNIDWVSRNAEFAILIGDKKYWGKGIGYEAGYLLVNYGFTRLNLHRIYCGTSVHNEQMKQLALKLKGQQEGCRRQHVFKNGKYADMVEFGILKSEFFK